MSGNNWLERDQSQSPGLLRIKEAQQAVVLAKTQEAQRAHGREAAKQEAERKRLEMIAKIEQKTAQVLPLLEEIKDFANLKKIYPVGKNLLGDAHFERENDLELVGEADVCNGKYPRMLELRYAYRGRVTKYSYSDFDTGAVPEGTKDAALLFGIRIKVDEDASAKIYKIEEVIIPSHGPYKSQPVGRGGGSELVPASGPSMRIAEKWNDLPDSTDEIRRLVADAFYDPAYLGSEELLFRQEVVPQPKQSEPQVSTGIGDLVKGFLGIR